jgi:hypothetical protein
MNVSRDRRHLMESNLDNVRAALMESECDDPVGFVIDATDRLGRQLVAHLISEAEGVGLEEAEAVLDSQTNEYRKQGQFPTYVFAAHWQFAEAVLPGFSPTASESLKNARSRRPPGHYLVVVIGSAGNTYASIAVSRPVSDGQHRTTGLLDRADAHCRQQHPK